MHLQNLCEFPLPSSFIRALIGRTRINSRRQTREFASTEGHAGMSTAVSQHCGVWNGRGEPCTGRSIARGGCGCGWCFFVATRGAPQKKQHNGQRLPFFTFQGMFDMI